MHNNSKYQEVLIIYFFSNIILTLVPLISLTFLTPLSILLLTFLILAKSRHGKLQKYLIQIKFFILLHIWFIINNLHNNNLIIRLFLYILSKQKEIL